MRAEELGVQRSHRADAVWMQFLCMPLERGADGCGSAVADGGARCSSDPTLHMLALPSDVQLAIVAHLAHEAGGRACCTSVAAIASLSCASRACCHLVSEARAWEQVGFALGLASPLHACAVPLPDRFRGDSETSSTCLHKTACFPHKYPRGVIATS